MNLLLKLSDWRFAAAGSALALVPILLHLLHRRRYRTVQWAAMSFLQTALRRQKRVVQMKNLLLLILRIAVLLCFGLALSRPYWSATGKAYDPSQPLHAILVIDNSMSMGYEEPTGTLLQKAKDRAKTFIQNLPQGSPVTIVPLCGPENIFPIDPIRSTENVLEVLDKIELVDLSGNVSLAIEKAKTAYQSLPSFTKRVVFFSDQQLNHWQGDLEDPLKDLQDLQFVDLSPQDPENSWIEDFQVLDAVVSAGSEMTFIVRLGHQGPTVRRNVQLTLSLGEKMQEMVTSSVDLQPGSITQVLLSCRWEQFESVSNSPIYVPARVSLADDSHDRLPADNHRYLSLPFVKSLPIVFVDQYGQEERPEENRYGETYPLRRLLSPVTQTPSEKNARFEVRHVRFEQLSRPFIENARVVVVAGVSDPQEHVELLREYLQQGGQLLIIAGGEFLPEKWNESAWLSGNGILPLPLQDDFFGNLPEDTLSQWNVFYLDFNSTKAAEIFRLPGVSEQQLAELYREPLFFRTVKIDDSQESDKQVLWAPQFRSQVIARFDNGLPFLVQRKIGHGRVMFVSSGLFSDWNTLAKSNAIILFDRVIQEMVAVSIPQRNYVTQRQDIKIPIEEESRDISYRLRRPGDGSSPEQLQYGYISPTKSGLTLHNPHRSGIYHVSAHRLQTESNQPVGKNQLWSLPLAVNHRYAAKDHHSESELNYLTQDQFQNLYTSGSHRWVGKSAKIRQEGVQVSGQDSWQLLLVLVFCGLLLELFILANGSLRLSRQT